MSIEELRRKLDVTDRQLMDLIAARQATIREIAEEKRSTGFPLRDYKREAQVFQGVRVRAQEVGVSPQVAEEVMRTLIRYSLTMQEQTSVTVHGKGDGQRALIIGGAGKMGGWFAQFMESQGFAVELADLRLDEKPGQIRDWRTSDLTHDYIVVATPLGATNEVLHGLAERRPDGVILDVGSLKSPLRSGLVALQAAGLRVTSIHPMFGPDAELLSGRHVVFIDLDAGDAFSRARALFSPTMAEQVVMTLDEHDRLVGYILGMSHALNLAFVYALSQSGVSAPRLMELSSTTFDAQFDIARRVAHESPDLYYEIQKLNDHGREALETFHSAFDSLRRSVVDGRKEDFVAIMRTACEYTDNQRRPGQQP